MTSLEPLPDIHSATGPLTVDQAVSGPTIPALVRLKIMSPGDYENFTLEWAHTLTGEYGLVQKRAGSGDRGLDIVAWVDSAGTGEWDNYQCKHYDHALHPGDIWLELGKICYNVYTSAYTRPRKSYFVAPQYVGNELQRLLGDAPALRSGLIEKWDPKCRSNITSTEQIVLDADFLTFINDFDFTIFQAMHPLTMIDQFRSSPSFPSRFGEGLPARSSAPPSPPAEIGLHEANYVRALLDAYEDRLMRAIGLVDDLVEVQLMDHFKRCRREFYSAESLREFSRDNVPAGTFEALMEDVMSGVEDILAATYPDAVERVHKTIAQAKLLPITSNALSLRINPADKGGICHQLANDLRLKWRQ